MKKILAAFISLLLVIPLASCTTKEAANNDGYVTDVIHINRGYNFAGMLSVIMAEKDLLTPYLPEGVSIEWSFVNPPQDIRDGLTSGNIDIAVLSSMSLITALENDFPLRIISSHITNSLRIFSKNPLVEDIDDLQNANGIYVSSLSSTTALAVMAMCKDEFNDSQLLSDKFVSQETSVSLMAYENSNDVDCLATGFPNSVKASLIEGSNLVADLTPYAREYDLGNYYVASKDFYEKNPLLIDAFRKAQQEALEFVRNNPDEAAEILAESSKTEKDVILNEMKDVTPRLEVTGYDKCASLMYEIGILDKAPKKLSEMPNYADIPKDSE